MKPSVLFKTLQGALPCLGLIAALSANAADKVFNEPEFEQGASTYAEGRLDDARALFEKLARRFPNDPNVLNNLAVIAAKQGNTDRAIKLFKRVITTDAAINTSYQNLSAIYAHLASLSYRDALSLEPAEPHTLELDLVGIPSQADAKSDDTLEAAAQAVRAKETGQPLVRDPQAPVLSERDRGIAAAVRRWGQAWARQDLNAYFASYIHNYTPPNGSHRTWKKQRGERVTAPQKIEVLLSDIHVRMTGTSEARVTFRQKYHSNRLSSSVIKELHMRKVSDEWKITLEQVL